ncbi:MAG: hypothetical protein ACOZF2_15700 [Thermodesulfobacteriota bacterium]
MTTRSRRLRLRLRVAPDCGDASAASGFLAQSRRWKVRQGEEGSVGFRTL